LGDEVHLACARGGQLHARMRQDPAGVRGLHAVRAPGEINPLAALRVTRLLRQQHPDLIAAHDAHALTLLAAGRAAARRDVPLVYHRRVDVPMRAHASARWKLRAPDLYICVSRAVAGALERGGVDPKRIRVVPSGGAGRTRIANAKRDVCAELGIGSNVRLLGIVAGLVPHKGHAILLDAFARIAGRAPDTHLIIAGSGALSRSLARASARHGTADRTHFLGERRDIDRLLSALDLFLVASVTEGLNTSILDAFSLGLPVVATRAGGIPELVVEGETGWLADPRDADSLANALERALADPARCARMAAEARSRFDAQFTARAMIERTRDCYRALLAEWRR
jgi:glycosyltransferase involved in cell wall biosynthesis